MPQTRLVTGSIGYRERIALPPGSVAQVKLSDVSRADAPAAVLAEQTITLIGTQVPVPFELDVEPRMFDARMRYSVSAQIRSAEGACCGPPTQATPLMSVSGSITSAC
ncbi:YbaY family lipoprotein [Halopseudomonas pachastrellae]|nr:YbaY family lipoprotein [Halopseudomonas pachastrellae]